MKFVIYPLLEHRSREAFIRFKTSFGHPYRYRPRNPLMRRLKAQTGLSEEQILNLIAKERAYIKQYRQYF